MRGIKSHRNLGIAFPFDAVPLGIDYDRHASVVSMEGASLGAALDDVRNSVASRYLRPGDVWQ
jgi:hypothetical protein